MAPLVAYVSGHGFGHATRLSEVLATVRRVLELPMPAPPRLDGAARAAARVLEALG